MPSSPPSLQRIVLTGFMGSGKTTVGRLLAQRLGWTFLDLDDAVAERVGLPVPEIFARHGEPHFRCEEAAALANGLTRQDIVLALGGGAAETEASRTLLRGTPGTAIVYLQGEFDVLHARCVVQSTEPGATARPILADIAAARQRFARRAPFYAEIATLTLHTQSRSPHTLAEALHAALGFQQSQP